MADGYFERGEVYWVKMGTGVGCEMNVTRPGLIVSANEVNNKSNTVLVAFLTTKEHRVIWNAVSVFATGRESWVLCDQIQTVDKSRFTTHLGTLSSFEMREVEDALEKVFDLGYADDTKETEIEALNVEKAELVAEIGRMKAEIEVLKNAKSDELVSVQVEAKMWQKLYDKSLDQLVEIKMAADMSSRMTKVPVAEEKVPVEPVKVEVDEPAEERVDINNCTQTALKKVGFSLAMARLIISRRPYKTVADLRTVPGMKANFFRIVEPKLCCTPMPVEPEKVVVVKDAPDPGYEVEPKLNINTATAKEIRAVTGWSEVSCYGITGKRKREGLYKSLDEITEGTRISKKMLDAQRDKLEV
jgi:mRNA interferase MazF